MCVCVCVERGGNEVVSQEQLHLQKQTLICKKIKNGDKMGETSCALSSVCSDAHTHTHTIHTHTHHKHTHTHARTHAALVRLKRLWQQQHMLACRYCPSQHLLGRVLRGEATAFLDSCFFLVFSRLTFFAVSGVCHSRSDLTGFCSVCTCVNPSPGSAKIWYVCTSVPSL